MLLVEIESLPDRISDFEAVEKGYSEGIRHAVGRLSAGMSVLIRCEKAIIPFLQQILKKKLKGFGKEISIIDGRDDSDRTGASRISSIVTGLRSLIYSTDTETVHILPYIDVITSLSHGGLSMEGKEIMTIIHENPYLVLAAFEDPDFPLPDIICQAFPAKVEMLGIDRRILRHLVTSEEARKFSSGKINLMDLYGMVSGLNPVRLREILKVFSSKADLDPNNPGMLDSYRKELRSYTVDSSAGLSTVNLNNDIAGYSGVKALIRENILDLLRGCLETDDEKAVAERESVIPRGIILHGPPGTGKTLFAKGIAEALNATVHSVSGPELKSKWVGEGEANVRRLFSRARATAPSVIVFDEIDSIASARTTAASDGGTQAAHSMVNQLLTEMDGFRKGELVFVIGTTNFPQSIDPAFLRPGRFELSVEIPYPEWDDRLAILTHYSETLGLGLSIGQLEVLAGRTGRLTEGGTPHSGDHLCAVMRDLKRKLIRSGGALTDLDAAIAGTGTMDGLTQEEERVVAIHEAGHVLMFVATGRIAEIKRVSIDGGMSDSLGEVVSESRKRALFTRAHLHESIMISLGGYAAELEIFSQTSTGASSDLSSATRTAESMVLTLGMGGIGVPRTYTDPEGRMNPYFNELVSPQMDAILLGALKEAREWLKGHRRELESIASALISRRTLSPFELGEILEA